MQTSTFVKVVNLSRDFHSLELAKRFLESEREKVAGLLIHVSVDEFGTPRFTVARRIRPGKDEQWWDWVVRQARIYGDMDTEDMFTLIDSQNEVIP